MRTVWLLALVVIHFIDLTAPSFADEPATATTDSQPAPTLLPQQPTMAPPAVSSDTPATAPVNSKPPLQGHLAQHAIGIRSLPPGREPDYIIGHFSVGIGPFITIPMNGPVGRTAELSRKFVKKWQGKQVNPCLLKLTKLNDDSGGYYFNTRTSKDGPCGWLMPMPKRPGKDKVIPWAIYFDQ